MAKQPPVEFIFELRGLETVEFDPDSVGTLKSVEIVMDPDNKMETKLRVHCLVPIEDMAETMAAFDQSIRDMEAQR